jgi:hypothetical protein
MWLGELNMSLQKSHKGLAFHLEASENELGDVKNVVAAAQMAVNTNGLPNEVNVFRGR